MKTHEAKDLIERYAHVSGVIMDKCGYVSPVAFAGNAKEHLSLDLTDMMAGPKSEKHRRKDAGMAAIRHILKEQDADWFLMIVEAWTVELKEAEGKSLEEARKLVPADLEDYEGRVEVVWFQFEDQECGQILARRKIVRKDGKSHLEPLEFIKDASQHEGRMVGLLPPRGRAQ